MANLFLFTLILSIIVLIAGLIKSSIFKRVTKIIPKRKTIVLVCFSLIIFSFIGIGVTAPKVEKLDNNDVVVDESKIEAPLSVNDLEILEEEFKPESESNAIIDESSEMEIQSQDVQTAQSEEAVTTPTIQNNSQYEYYSISSVVDGDTVKVNINGTTETLRLIGVDTPETVDPRKPVQCFGIEASNKAKELLTGKKVSIEKDSTQGERDIYGRLLTYIYREDGLFFNKYMIEQGYAHEYTYNTPYKYQAEFKVAENSARENQLGLWSPDTCNGDTTSSAEESLSVTTQETASDNISSGKYYTSSYHTSNYYYLEDCNGWQSLSEKYLKSYDSLDALLDVYPDKTLSPQCQ